MKTAAAIDALARLVIFAAMILLYQYFIATYLERQPEKAWAPRLWRHLERAWRDRSKIAVPSAYYSLRTKKTVDLPTERDSPAKGS